MRITYKIALLGLISAFVFYSCRKDDISEPDLTSMPPAKSGSLTSNDFFVLADSLDFPHSVSNMQAAFDFLDSAGQNVFINGVTIEATHIYVRFTPQTESELAELVDIANSNSYYHLEVAPIHYSYEEDGDFREFDFDSDSAQHVIETPLYSTLPINAEFPNRAMYVFNSICTFESKS